MSLHDKIVHNVQQYNEDEDTDLLVRNILVAVQQELISDVAVDAAVKSLINTRFGDVKIVWHLDEEDGVPRGERFEVESPDVWKNQSRYVIEAAMDKVIQLQKRKYDVIIVSGDRNATYKHWSRSVEHMIDTYVNQSGVVIHGNARGIDTLVKDYCKEKGIGTVAYPAKWDVYGNSAGPIRNEQMLSSLLIDQEDGHRIGVLAFYNNLEESRGTKHMVDIAQRENVNVHLVDEEGNIEDY